MGVEWAIQQSKELNESGVPVCIIIRWENRIILAKLPVRFFRNYFQLFANLTEKGCFWARASEFIKVFGFNKN